MIPTNYANKGQLTKIAKKKQKLMTKFQGKSKKPLFWANLSIVCL